MILKAFSEETFLTMQVIKIIAFCHNMWV